MNRGTSWRVAHTRPRGEKKVAGECERAGIGHNLPLYRSVKRYRGKLAVFLKPLFPGYVFLRATEADVERVGRFRHVAKILTPPDQAEFEHQFGAILAALESECEIRLAPQVSPGERVQLTGGPLRGLEGRVLRREGMIEVVLWLDFLGQGAAVKVSAEELSLI